MIDSEICSWGDRATQCTNLGLLDDVEHEGFAIGATVRTDAQVHLLGELVRLESGAEAKDGIRRRLL